MVYNVYRKGDSMIERKEYLDFLISLKDLGKLSGIYSIKFRL